MPHNLKTFLNIIVLIAVVLAFALFIRDRSSPIFSVMMPSYGVEQSTLGILVKKNDPFSEQVAKLYINLRNIPKENVFYMELPDQNTVSAEVFQTAFLALQKQLPAHIQGLVATWQKPYKVDCMSITSALSFGFDHKWCQPQGKGCQLTEPSPYFNDSTRMPWTDLNIRPTMLLTGESLLEVESLINRGIKADFSNPKNPNVFLLKTHDAARSAREGLFEMAQDSSRLQPFNIHYLDLSEAKQDFITNQSLLVYQTGSAKVPEITSNQYLPGAIADHLTSFGGKIFESSGQMSSLKWLEAGATGTYGTVVEPCNFVHKFPNPNIFLEKYAKGETLLEAYWKSVLMPGEGLFIGEPLARPFGIFSIKKAGDKFLLLTNRLNPSHVYDIFYLDKTTNNYQKVKKYSVYLNRKTNVLMIQIQTEDSIQYKIEVSSEKMK